jgi:hypothetical protein
MISTEDNQQELEFISTDRVNRRRFTEPTGYRESEHEVRYNRIQMLAEGNERLMLEGLSQIYNSKADAVNVMVLGRTGSGKSAFINLLAGKPLFARRDEDTMEFILDSNDQLPGIVIGNNNSSETSIPRSWVYDENTVYWDCPGFDDNRGIEYEIANAFLIKKLFEVNQACKILIVVSDIDVNERRKTRLLSAIRALDVFFQSNVEMVASGLMLVVAGADPDKTVISIQGTLQKMIDTTEFDLTEPQKQICRIFMHNSMILFQMPRVEGAIDIACGQEYLAKIENLAIINNIQVKAIISSGAEVIVLEAYANLLRSINLEIDTFLSNQSLKLQGVIVNTKRTEEIQQLSMAIRNFQTISNRLANTTVWSNKQLLELVPECVQLDPGCNIAQLKLSLKNLLRKTEIFEFLEQFVAVDSRIKLGIHDAIIEYLANCIRDANLAIQSIEQKKVGEKLITVQHDLQRESAARARIEQTAALERRLNATREAAATKRSQEQANQISNLKTQVQELINRPAPPAPSGGGGSHFPCLIL